jgi:hypothetical protein
MKKVFYIKLNLFSKIISSLALVICSLLVWYLPQSMTDPGYVLVLMFLVLVVVTAWGFHPMSYSRTEDALIIRRPFSNASYPFADIESVSWCSKLELGISFRAFASGGLFGYFGLINFSSIGTCTVYAGNYRNPILLRLKNGSQVILSEEDNAFYTQIRQRINETYKDGSATKETGLSAT